MELSLELGSWGSELVGRGFQPCRCDRGPATRCPSSKWPSLPLTPPCASLQRLRWLLVVQHLERAGLSSHTVAIPLRAGKMRRSLTTYRVRGTEAQG